MDNILVSEVRRPITIENFVSSINLSNDDYSRLKNNYFSNSYKTWTRFPRIRCDSLSDPIVNNDKVVFLPSEENKEKNYLIQDIPIEKTYSSPFLWYYKNESINSLSSSNRSRFASIQANDSRKSSESKEADTNSIQNTPENNKPFRSSVDSTVTSEEEFLENITEKRKKISKKRESLQKTMEKKKNVPKVSFLSDDELKNLNISEKFLKEAKNMIYLPESNSFCPDMTNEKEKKKIKIKIK